MQESQLHLVESVSDVQDMMSWLGGRRDWLAIDTETGGLDWWRDPLRLVQIGDEGSGWAVPWELWGGAAKEAIEGYTDITVMHNSKFDLHFLETNGVKVNRRNLHDTMPMAGLLEPILPKGLKPASERHVGDGARQGERALKTAMSKNKWTWATVPLDLPEYWAYSALDVVLTSRLAAVLYPKMVKEELLRAYEVEVATAQVLCDMERKGLRIDLEYANEMSSRIEQLEDELFVWFKDDLGIKNPRSDAQLVNWFQTQGYKFTVLTARKNISLDSSVLEGIASSRPELAEIANAVNRLRDFHKMKKTYFDAFLDHADGDRIHTSINPMGARTARMSSSRPNLQNIPARKHGKLVRDTFIAADNHVLIAADFDQIEYRIMASRAGEQSLIDAINGGQDLHTYMTSVVYKKRYEDVQPKERAVMKNATFAFLYGAGDAKFAGMAGITTEEAGSFRKLYSEQFPAIAQYGHNISIVGRNEGWVRTGYLGRKQYIDDPNKAYKLMNYATQGEAGDVLKQKMVELSMSEAGEFMRLPIHDEILFEVPVDRVDEIKAVIEHVMPETKAFQVPLSIGADVIERWGDKYA